MTLEGSVEARNAHGIRINGEWLNRSKFGQPVDLPDVGAVVRAEVDGKGYLKSIDILDGSSSRSSERDDRIARLTVLKAAAHFAAGRGDIRSSDVLRIAESWLAWVETDERD